ncbi:glycosyltransferase family 2 protein [Desulfurococcaceae archaeon MEX13E-LK6-19]|nr:glycosyltransferase family 2 protein [Desulfurococcaceae archaeon MEX13E-LK6-19]
MKSLVSVIIPVYRESRILPRLLEKLSRQSIDCEVIVVVDEPTESFRDLMKHFWDRVVFIVNEERVGKAMALNKAVGFSSGEIIVFLDSDVDIPDDPEFLEKIVEEMRDCDILDFKKVVVKNSLLAKMTYYEYVGANTASWLTTRCLGRCPAINGSGFAVRRSAFVELDGFRRVISEDFDFATRAFLKKYKFKYTTRVFIYNYVHSSWQKWIVQRKRWSLGCALWLREWWKSLLKECLRNLQVFIPALLALIPSIVYIVANFFIPDMIIYKLFTSILFFIAVKFNIIFPLLLLTTLGIGFMKNLAILLISFLAFTLIFMALSKKLDFNFKTYEFLAYYFVYSPLVLFTIIVALIKVFILRNKEIINKLDDWKI